MYFFFFGFQTFVFDSFWLTHRCRKPADNSNKTLRRNAGAKSGNIHCRPTDILHGSRETTRGLAVDCRTRTGSDRACRSSRWAATTTQCTPTYGPLRFSRKYSAVQVLSTEQEDVVVDSDDYMARSSHRSRIRSI